MGSLERDTGLLNFARTRGLPVRGRSRETPTALPASGGGCLGGRKVAPGGGAGRGLRRGGAHSVSLRSGERADPQTKRGGPLAPCKAQENRRARRTRGGAYVHGLRPPPIGRRAVAPLKGTKLGACRIQGAAESRAPTDFLADPSDGFGRAVAEIKREGPLIPSFERCRPCVRSGSCACARVAHSAATPIGRAVADPLVVATLARARAQGGRVAVDAAAIQVPGVRERAELPTDSCIPDLSSCARGSSQRPCPTPRGCR
jgi:hypothetical protein